MNASSPLTRRALITTAGTITVASASALVLAACSPGGGGEDGGSAPQNSGPKFAAGTTVAALADVPVGGTKAAVVDGKPVLLAQPTSGNVVCYSAVCPHQGCTVAAAGKQFDCPCHGSSFVAATGAVISGPAVTGLSTITVKVTGANIVTA